MNKNDQYQIPTQENIDNHFAEIAHQNPDIAAIGREIADSYNNDRSAVGAAAIDTTRLEFDATPEQQPHPSIAEISGVGAHIHELRSERLAGSRSDYTLGA